MTRTAEEVLKEQREKHGVIVPAKSAPPSPNTDLSGALDYLSGRSGTNLGTFFKFAKDGVYRQTSDDKEVPEGTLMRVIPRELRVGYIKFNGPGNAPDRRMAAIFQGEKKPAREDLGELDPAHWDIGPNGLPSDPWVEQTLVPMQRVDDGELFVFQTTSETGRRACDTLIAECVRVEQKEPEYYVIIKLRISGFQHKKKPQIGWVKTPAFERVGKSLKDDTTINETSVREQLNDDIPY